MHAAGGFFFDVWLGQAESLGIFSTGDIDGAVFDINGFFGESDDSFDKKLLGVVRISEYHYIHPFGFSQTVGDFVNDEVIAVLKGGYHRGTGNDEGLSNEYSYGHHYYHRNDAEADKLEDGLLCGFFGF